jgi:hypothetical protein
LPLLEDFLQDLAPGLAPISPYKIASFASSKVLSEFGVFENKLSDHYPILTVLK